jgi:hypothetical protein
VVDVPAPVVDDRLADVFGHLFDVPHQLLDRHALQVGVALGRLVQVIDVGLVVPVVVDFHCQGVDVRLQRVVRIRQGRQGESHDVLPWIRNGSVHLPPHSRG